MHHVVQEIRKLEGILSLVNLLFLTPVAGRSSLLSKVSHEQASSECRDWRQACESVELKETEGDVVQNRKV